MSPMPPITFRLNPTYDLGDVTIGHLGYRNRTILAIRNLHNTPVPTITFQFNPIYGLAHVLKEFQDGCHGAQLRYRNGMGLAILNFHVAQCLPPSLGSIRLTVLEQITIEYFQDGHRGYRLGYRIKMILVVLNLHVAPMPPIKFWLSQAYNSGADVI